MNEGVFKEKSMQFAIRIVNLHKHLSSKRFETTISKQPLANNYYDLAQLSEPYIVRLNMPRAKKISFTN